MLFAKLGSIRDRFKVMALEQTESFQRLDNATKCAIAQVLEALEVNRSHFVQIIDVQTEKIQTLHADAEENLTLEIESATATLEEQNQRIHRECSEQQERTRAEVLGAITEASSAYDRSLYRSNADFSVRAREEHKRTRLNIGQKLDNNREIMKREVHGIQHGMQQLHLVLDQKAEELKELMIKLNTAREDPQRPMLEYGGNRVTFITIVSEYLYNGLYVRSLECSIPKYEVH